MAKILIWDGEEFPPVSDTVCLLWSNYSTSGKEGYVSISKLAEENSDLLRQRFLAWIFELGEVEVKGKTVTDTLELRPGFSYWWMTLIVEKCNFSKSPQIDDAIKLLAFDMWSRTTEIQEVQFVSSHKRIADCLEQWCKKRKIKFIYKKKKVPDKKVFQLRNVYDFLPYACQGLIWLLRYISERWKLRGIGKRAWQNSDAEVTFVSYFSNLVPEALAVQKFESRYWASLTNALDTSEIKTNWIHLYMKDSLVADTGKAAQVLRDFNQGGEGMQHHVMLDSFLTFSLIIKIVKDWFKIYRVSRGLENVASQTATEGVSLWPLFEEDWRQSMVGKTAMSNVWHFNLFEHAMKLLPTQALGIYMQENMDWEPAFLWAWKTSGHKRSVGFPHSTIRFWDLRYFFDPRSYQQEEKNPMQMPDKVGVSGPMNSENLLKSGYPSGRLIEVETLRYLYLGYKLKKREYPLASGKKARKLLVLGDFQQDENVVLMRLLEAAIPSLPSLIEIIVKPHPLSPVSTDDYPGLKMTLTNDTLEKLLPHADVAYTGSVTSAVIDAYLSGTPVVSLLNNHKLNLSPLRGKPGVSFVSSGEELSGALIRAFSKKDRDQVQDIFYMDPDLPRWKKVLSGKW